MYTRNVIEDLQITDDQRIIKTKNFNLYSIFSSSCLECTSPVCSEQFPCEPSDRNDGEHVVWKLL